MMYGRNVRGPMQILKETLEGKVPEDEEMQTAYQYVLELHERLQQTYAIAQEELKKAGVSSSKYRQRKAKLRQLKQGDKVLLLLPTSSNKLLAQWQGPYEVKKKISDLNYVIEVCGRDKVYHINMLKLYVSPEIPASASSLREAKEQVQDDRELGLAENPLNSGILCAAVQENAEPGLLVVLTNC